MESQIIPKRFLFGNREDYILKNQLERIAAQGEENLNLANKNAHSMLPTVTPPNTPWYPKGVCQNQKDSHKHQEGRSDPKIPLQKSLSEPLSNMESPSSKLLGMKATLCNSQKENQILKSQFMKVEAQNRNLIDARNRREIMTKDPTETILYGLLQQNWQQIQRIEALENTSFKSLDGQPEERLNPQQINAAMEKMKLALGSILHKNGIKFKPNYTTDINSDLQHLLHTLYGTEKNLKLEMKDLDPQLLLRGLALAAVRQWVFMTDFPGFQENRLSKAQIKVMAQKGDWKCARKFALESYISIVRDPSFQEQDLHEQTQNLVMRFARALAPVFKPPYDSEKVLRNIWVDTEGTVGMLFKTALAYKATTVTTGHQYDFVVYPPGASAAKAIPAVEDFTVPQEADQAGKKLPCEAWKHASLFVYEIESSTERNDLTDATINLSNFSTQEGDVRAKKCCLESTIIISKELDESKWDADQDINLVARAETGGNNAPIKAVQEQKAVSVARTTRNSVGGQAQSTVKDSSQSGVKESFVDRASKQPQETSSSGSSETTKLSQSCPICLNPFTTAIFKGHVEKKPPWCQPPCSVCGGKYSQKSDVAKHRRHQKKAHGKAELDSTKEGKTSGLDCLKEFSNKKPDAANVAAVAKENLQQEALKKSPKKPHRRSMRLSTRGDIVSEVGDDITSEVEDSIASKVQGSMASGTEAEVSPEVQDESIRETFIAGKKHSISTNLKPFSCEKCGGTFKSPESAGRHKRMEVCNPCPECGNWFDNKKMFSHGCRQKVKNPDCGEKASTVSNETSEHQASVATKQVSAESLHVPETEKLEIPNDGCTKTQTDVACSQAEHPLSDEIEETPTPATSIVPSPQKRPRPCEDQHHENQQTHGEVSVPDDSGSQDSGGNDEELEETRPRKLRRLSVLQEDGAMQNCPRSSDQRYFEIDSNHAQAEIPPQSTIIEFEQWRPFTPNESNERASGMGSNTLNIDNFAEPRNVWDLNSDYIAFEPQHDTFLGLLGNWQQTFDNPQGF